MPAAKTKTKTEAKADGFRSEWVVMSDTEHGIGEVIEVTTYKTNRVRRCAVLAVVPKYDRFLHIVEEV